jgi:glycosyltransferase involved in cell wall biosynthesis
VTSSSRDPTVSVILPTYNRQQLLREAIDSVVGQTFRGWELVVADDGSTDGTREYLTGLRDPRIRLVFLDHGGSPARTRTAGLRVARGEWVAFLDSDDLWLPTKLALQLEQLTTHPACRWGYTAYQLVDIDGRPVARRPPVAYGVRSGWILADLLTFEVSPAMPTLMVRRSLFDEVGGFDETIALRGDYDLALRLAARSEVWGTSETLSLVRDHANRTTLNRRRAELFWYNERVFRKAATSSESKAIRALCIRQCATQLAGMAHALSNEGKHAAAFAAVARALRDAPLAIPVWRATAGCLLRALRVWSSAGLMAAAILAA